MEIDFDGTNQQPANNGGQAAPNDKNPMNAPDINGGTNGAADINGQNNNNQPTPPPTNPPANQPNNNNNNGGDNSNQGQQSQQQGANGNQVSSTGELEVGSQVEFDGQVYTVAENGDLVDANNNVFKAAADVQDWIKSLEVEEGDDTELNLANIQKAIGLDIIGEDGNPIEYTDDVNGIKAYVNDVIANSYAEAEQAAYTRIYNDNPLVKSFIDYITIHGDAKGFGEVPDRSGVELDKDNEVQQQNIILMAAQEFGNKSVNENYIKYLKDSGALYDEAKSCLEALQEKDKQVREQIAQQAKAQEEAEIERANQYYNYVNNLIKGRTIGQYSLPETFVKEVNGQKVTVNLDDFYDFVSRPVTDNEGRTYNSAAEMLFDKLPFEKQVEMNMINNWLLFTGGTYKDIVDMAIKENQVKVLKLKTKQQSTNGTVRITKPTNNKFNANDLVFD